jgi:hypothetical protein
MGIGFSSLPQKMWVRIKALAVGDFTEQKRLNEKLRLYPYAFKNMSPSTGCAKLIHR